MIEKIKKQILKVRNYRIKSGRLKYWRNVFQERNRKLKQGHGVLSKEERKEISAYFSKFGLQPLPMFHDFYKRATGKFDVRFIPDDIYYTFIDPYYNDWQLARYLDNKTFYQYLFPDLTQPELLAYRQNGFWLDGHNNLITEDEVEKLIKNADICFLKQATDSEGGKNIYVLESASSKDIIKDSFSKIHNDLVIQKGLKQSSTLSKLNSSSVNTIRLLTLLRKDGTVKLCSSSLRMGINGARVDNASSGGITVGVLEDGSLNAVAFAADGRSFDYHPTSKIRFDKITIPNYKTIVDLIKREASKYPHFRLISWDIALDENDLPVLIEANLKYGELEFHQLNNGPIFGDDTEEILKEVFKGGEMSNHF